MDILYNSNFEMKVPADNAEVSQNHQIFSAGISEICGKIYERILLCKRSNGFFYAFIVQFLQTS